MHKETQLREQKKACLFFKLKGSNLVKFWVDSWIAVGIRRHHDSNGHKCVFPAGSRGEFSTACTFM